MRELLSITIPTSGFRAVCGWSIPMMVGTLFAACGDDNQLPFATVDTLPTTEIMTERSRQEYNVDDYFSDPDQDPLSFTVSTDDATVATAVVEDLDDSPKLVIEGVTGGETMVTLTATDPDGGEAQLFGRVLVVEPVLFWRDDFDDATSDWSFNFAGYHSYEEIPGYLSVYIRYAYYFFAGERNDNVNAAEWMVSTSVAVEAGSTNQTVGIRSRPAFSSLDCEGAEFLWGWVGETDPPESNWGIRYSICGDGGTAVGNSAAVASIGEFSDVHLGVRLGKMELYVGETLVFAQEIDDEEGWPHIHTKTGLFGYQGAEAEQWIYFDWAELWGIPTGERGAS